MTTKHLSDIERLMGDAVRYGVTSAMLDGEVGVAVAAGIASVTDESDRREQEEDAAWTVLGVNSGGLESQLEFLLEMHDYRWVHDLLVDCTR